MSSPRIVSIAAHRNDRNRESTRRRQADQLRLLTLIELVAIAQAIVVAVSCDRLGIGWPLVDLAELVDEEIAARAGKGGGA